MKTYKKKITVLFIVFFLCTTATFVSIEYYKLTKPGLIVLLYHKITDDYKGYSKYDLTIDKFKEHLRILKNNGYSTILPTDLINKDLNKFPEKSVIISFDDGTEDHFNTVFPTLIKNGFSAVFFVVAKYIDNDRVLTESQLREMSVKGMEIGSHSFSHPFLEVLNHDDLFFELIESKEKIEKITSKTVVSFAPPGGWYNENVVETAKTVGYEAFFSCEIGKNDLSEVPFIFKRIEVLGDISNKQFEELPRPSIYLLGYKIRQSIKFFLHDAIGIENYLKLGELIKKLKFYTQKHYNQIKYAKS